MSKEQVMREMREMNDDYRNQLVDNIAEEIMELVLLDFAYDFDRLMYGERNDEEIYAHAIHPAPKVTKTPVVQAPSTRDPSKEDLPHVDDRKSTSPPIAKVTPLPEEKTALVPPGDDHKAGVEHSKDGGLNELRSHEVISSPPAPRICFPAPSLMTSRTRA
jgi:hypothetical protein